MGTTSTKGGLSITPTGIADRLMPVNTASSGFDATRDLPAGFLEFLAPLHAALHEAHAGKQPTFLPPSVSTMQAWQIELPEWCVDQRNQMTGPADDAEL